MKRIDEILVVEEDNGETKVFFLEERETAEKFAEVNGKPIKIIKLSNPVFQAGKISFTIVESVV
jgi:predicted metalloenzyme YecM